MAICVRLELGGMESVLRRSGAFPARIRDNILTRHQARERASSSVTDVTAVSWRRRDETQTSDTRLLVRFQLDAKDLGGGAEQQLALAAQFQGQSGAGQAVNVGPSHPALAGRTSAGSACGRDISGLERNL